MAEAKDFRIESHRERIAKKEKLLPKLGILQKQVDEEKLDKEYAQRVLDNIEVKIPKVLKSTFYYPKAISKLVNKLEKKRTAYSEQLRTGIFDKVFMNEKLAEVKQALDIIEQDDADSLIAPHNESHSSQYSPLPSTPSDSTTLSSTNDS
ncbi:hypothetical protein DPMN_112112 [Dreissena polymorpha]|uniref:Uncharacterized protein n=2 Tax=Dreissena polymorpha TaxID=45954 RepID=A0A9D4KFW6_DREPO|nr:hypothetical protein DPMN_112112 [Dreissena polymorpha]